ncbi:MAG: HAD family hydrolase [Dysgonamonadaceae bacterium]|jgi:putative hydrolase of the HAD superfamily|nr:HAD family hydrolase [Dysgonamonadaceae bacterium]
MIKHISFDFWLTLFRPNPLFRTKRAAFIKNCFHPESSVTDIVQCISAQDKIFDNKNQEEDTKIPAVEMFRTVLEKLNILSDDLQRDATTLINRSNQLFLEYPPEPLNDHVPSILEKLVSMGITLSIGSNTGFVEGETLRIFLQQKGLFNYFSFCIFSDEIKSSKPSARFFNAILNQSQQPKQQILHIGDNPVADAMGAAQFGFQYLLIANQDYSFDDIGAKL